MLSQNHMQAHKDEVSPVEKPLFLDPSHLKPLREHDLRGFPGEANLFYPTCHKTAPKAGGEAVPNRDIPLLS